ncbi:MAG: hypothetical protein DMF83_27275 [Acidobacteria bacterium]|nr:MAG: hypothetical protein DMF83_27275 [Acidobacteriota bacterium]
MRSLAAAVIVLASLPAGAVAQSQVELSVGGGIGSSFTRRAPFALDGQTYGGPYRTCPEGIAAGLCLQAGASDLAFALETHYSSLAVVGLEARRGVGGPFLAGVGVLGGLALRSQRILTADTGEVVDGRPPATQDLVDAADSHSFSSSNGVGALAYLHAGLRWERGFESRTTMGYRSSGTRVFVEAGGGLLAALPGGGDAGVGHPPGLHVAGGLVFKRTSAHPLTLSLRYVKALAKRDEATLVASRQSWAVVQVGWRSGR